MAGIAKCLEPAAFPHFGRAQPQEIGMFRSAPVPGAAAPDNAGAEEYSHPAGYRLLQRPGQAARSPSERSRQRRDAPGIDGVGYFPARLE